MVFSALITFHFVHMTNSFTPSSIHFQPYFGCEIFKVETILLFTHVQQQRQGDHHLDLLEDPTKKP